MANGSLKAGLLASMCCACSSSSLIDMGPVDEPDGEIAVVGGCIVSLEHESSDNGPWRDVLVYDASLRLLEHERTYFDGVTSTREWQWSDGDKLARRDWFDGARETAYDDAGRVTMIVTYDADGMPEWTERVRYGALGLITSRTVEHVVEAKASLHMQTSYEYENGMPTLATTTLGDGEVPAQSIAFEHRDLGDTIERKGLHDTDGDGETDSRATTLFAEDGRAIERTPPSGQAVAFSYEGPRCAELAASWPLGDPLFFDM